jgi:hypothetical protein
MPLPLVFKARLPSSGTIELPLGKEVEVFFNGTARQGGNKAELKVDNPPAGLDFETGSISRETKSRTGNRKSRPKRGGVTGQITLKAGDPLKPGDRFNIVVVAVLKKGKEETLCPAPAIPVKIVKPRSN